MNKYLDLTLKFVWELASKLVRHLENETSESDK